MNFSQFAVALLFSAVCVSKPNLSHQSPSSDQWLVATNHFGYPFLVLNRSYQHDECILACYELNTKNTNTEYEIMLLTPANGMYECVCTLKIFSLKICCLFRIFHGQILCGAGRQQIGLHAWSDICLRIATARSNCVVQERLNEIFRCLWHTHTVSSTAETGTAWFGGVYINS